MIIFSPTSCSRSVSSHQLLDLVLVLALVLAPVLTKRMEMRSSIGHLKQVAQQNCCLQAAEVKPEVYFLLITDSANAALLHFLLNYFVVLSSSTRWV